MQVQIIGLDKVDTDNNENYINSICAVIESVDELCSLEIVKSNTSYSFRISPSVPIYSQYILKSVLDYNNMLGIRVELSKSIKKNSTLNFFINL